MSYQLDPGFGRGEVLGVLWDHPIEKTYPTKTGASQVLTTKQFTDVDPHTGAVLSNEIVTCVAVRNDTGADLAAGEEATVSGYTGVVDEYLTKDVPENEVCWLVVAGPTQKPVGTRVRLTPAAGTDFALPKIGGDDDADVTPIDTTTTP
jgi:hypothetical protein